MVSTDAPSLEFSYTKHIEQLNAELSTCPRNERKPYLERLDWIMAEKSRFDQYADIRRQIVPRDWRNESSYTFNDLAKSGVYLIDFDGGHSYIGQASIILIRWGQHISDLQTGKHCNWKMAELFKSVGIGGMRVRILEECPIPLLFEREKQWIYHLSPTLNIYGRKGRLKRKLVEADL